MTKFLVLLEDSQESAVAIRFAAKRAARVGASVTVLAVIHAEDIAHGIGVAEVMRAEAREHIEVHYEVYARWMQDRMQVPSELIILEGEPAAQLMAFVTEDEEVAIVVIGIGTVASAVAAKLMRELATMPCAVTFVPVGLPAERLEAIS